ncbi:MAG: PadR family transcriptional regulator [Bacillota bacterium]|nr:PadR family transcriptional regulator [Bacillota bacterium]
MLLVLRKRPIHGYELMEELNSMPFLKPVPDPGVVYRHLRRLEDEGIVESRLEPGSGGPARKVYTLTAEGEGYFRAWVSNLQSQRDNIDNLLAVAEPVVGAESLDKSSV